MPDLTCLTITEKHDCNTITGCFHSNNCYFYEGLEPIFFVKDWDDCAKFSKEMHEIEKTMDGRVGDSRVHQDWEQS